jgi:hypothetical protein
MSAKAVMGVRKDLSSRQDRYAEAMKSFGLCRGEKNTGVIHDTARDHYRRIKIVEENIDKLVSKGFLGVNTSKTIENYHNALKTALMDLQKIRDNSRKIDHRHQKMMSELKNQVDILQRECFDLSFKLQESSGDNMILKRDYDDALLYPDREKHKKNREALRRAEEVKNGLKKTTISKKLKNESLCEKKGYNKNLRSKRG